MLMKFKDKLALVPHKPGSYQMKDKNGTIIYVGKAKDLHKRVSSYFNSILLLNLNWKLLLLK